MNRIIPYLPSDPRRYQSARFDGSAQRYQSGTSTQPRVPATAEARTRSYCGHASQRILEPPHVARSSVAMLNLHAECMRSPVCTHAALYWLLRCHLPLYQCPIRVKTPRYYPRVYRLVHGSLQLHSGPATYSKCFCTLHSPRSSCPAGS